MAARAVAHWLHQWLLRPLASRARPPDGRGARRLKGPERPIQDVASRAEVLAALEAVDLVVVFDEDTPAELIRQVRPAVLVKGGDYTRDQVVGHDTVESYGGEVILIDLVPGQSTTSMVARSAGRTRT